MLSRPVESALTASKWTQQLVTNSIWRTWLRVYVIFLSCKPYSGARPGTARLHLIMDPPNPTLTSNVLQPERSQPLWVQQPDIQQTKVVSRKEKVPDGLILRPEAGAPSPTVPRPSGTSPVTVYKFLSS